MRTLWRMRIHHLSCGTLCPVGGRLMSERKCRPLRGALACHCLLIETGQGLVLVDTGLGTLDMGNRRLEPFFRFQCKPLVTPEQTAVRQVQRLGFSPRDVRHIVLTHLDFDHAGGLDDFPGAQVHLHVDEAEAAGARSGLIARGRYRPEQWRSHDRWNLYREGGEPWFGFASVRNVAVPEILLIPLPGHTWGHCGVAVAEPGGGWLLHAGDAFFDRRELDPQHPRCRPGLRYYQLQMEVDRRARLRNQRRLRDLAREHDADVRIICAHDPVMFEEWARRSPEERAPAPWTEPPAERPQA
jgi:glyoxylase-like metal-dependent hydrolase (beta-lactamase superfamily II)